MAGLEDSRDRQRGVRLADVRLPRYWLVSVIVALLLGGAYRIDLFERLRASARISAK
jgi:hypothetical protein